jgi:molybdopterin-synthase adenylyltransferase
MDPEPMLDSGYGTGAVHRPMTAVGSDLALVGQYAAKVAVATLLEYSGHYDQRIDGDWAVVGLRGDLRAPEPFRLSPGEVRWLPHVASVPSCPTCGTEE